MVHVRAYTRGDGTKVRQYTRSAPTKSGKGNGRGALWGIVAVIAAAIFVAAGLINAGPDTATATTASYTRLARSEDALCAPLSYGQAQDFLAAHPCEGMTRALYTVTHDNGDAHVAVAWVRMPTFADADSLKILIDRQGTGNITELTAGVSFTGQNYDSRIEGTTVTLTQAESALGHKLPDDVLEDLAAKATALTP